MSTNYLFQKGVWSFLKDMPAIQHFTIFCSLLSLPVVIWIMFPSHGDIKKQKKSASLIAWAQTSHNTDSKALKLWLSFLIPCSKRTEGMYMFTPSRHEAPCQIYYSENTTFSPKGKWHPEWQQEIMRVLVLARAARSPSDRGFSPYRNCKKQQTTKVCSPFGAVSRFPHTYTLQSSFLPPFSWVMAILFIKIYI